MFAHIYKSKIYKLPNCKSKAIQAEELKFQNNKIAHKQQFHAESLQRREFECLGHVKQPRLYLIFIRGHYGNCN